MLNNNLKRITT